MSQRVKVPYAWSNPSTKLKAGCPEALASRKTVWGDPYTEVSETAKAGTDPSTWLRINWVGTG